MKIQKSYSKTHNTGTLYLVPTPIGNLEDITYRALATLKAVDRIAAEDTRQTLKLCRHFEIEKPLISYHEHNKIAQEAALINHLEQGDDIALVTDAGTPAVSDPGQELVTACVRQGLSVVSLPGPNAAVTGLVASGLPTDQFLFYGFLPRNKKERANTLDELSRLPYTLIFYEAPHRLKVTLKALAAALGDRQASVGRELTKRYETYIRGTLRELVDWCENTDIKGECCVFVEGEVMTENDADSEWWHDLTLTEHVNHYVLVKQQKSKEAIKIVAKERNIQKRDVYQAYHVDEES